MLKWTFSVVAALALSFGAGCQSDGVDSRSGKMSSNRSGDVCSMCAGDQKMSADGKCPVCGMKVADACPKCAGVQPMSALDANGKCPMCEAKKNN